MNLQDQIRNDLKDAMRSGDAMKRDVLRMLESAVKNTAIEKKLDRSSVDDAIVQDTVRRSIKQRKDSIEQYTAGGRADLAEKEQQEIEVLQSYMPKQMDETELRGLIEAALSEAGVSGPQDFGKAMGKVMQAVAGRAEGDVVKKIVQELLAQS